MQKDARGIRIDSLVDHLALLAAQGADVEWLAPARRDSTPAGGEAVIADLGCALLLCCLAPDAARSCVFSQVLTGPAMWLLTKHSLPAFPGRRKCGRKGE
ncbi:hypothetical protein EGY31_16350 [Burkholderia multivorans]|nr:hypothetical protein EGY31_16350 [Burkholderia multivorans]